MNRGGVNEPPDNYVLAPLTISSYLLALIISFQQKKKKKKYQKRKYSLKHFWRIYETLTISMRSVKYLGC